MTLSSDGVVLLTRFVAGDAAVMMDGDADRELRRRFGAPADFIPSLAHSERIIATWNEEYERGESYSFAVRDCQTAELVGGCQLRPLRDGSANLSYWTYPAHRGEGFATRAATLAVNLALRFGIGTLEVVVDPDNGPSLRVAARAGFTAIGERNGQVLHVLDLSHRPAPPSGPRMPASDR